MRQGFARKATVVSLGLCLALTLSLSLTACGGNKEKPQGDAPQQTATADNNKNANQNETPVDPNAKTALEQAESGVPSTEVPEINRQGSVHKDENLYFLVVGEYASKDEAQKALTEVQNKLGKDNPERNYWYVFDTNEIGGFTAGKFVVAEVYPSEEAVQGYDALNYAKENLATSPDAVYLKQGTFKGGEKIVVFGVDVQ